MTETAKAGEGRSVTNLLAQEKSPYLLQHADNPVDWFPWGEEAFKKASSENKPILLSVGYSTCHWCHVMEEESFEDKATAELMNRHFISVKVDREERPDIDGIYMRYVIGVTGRGGWPMTVFLTPDRKPFYGGTYFPPEDRFGMPGFKRLLGELADAWENRRDEILKSADSAVQYLNRREETAPPGTLGPDSLEAAFKYFESAFDERFGGFGRAPKFPSSHNLSFLLRYWKRSGEPKALAFVEQTLRGMAHGGLYDQIGGGFHRYSTDERWHVPHFEKMLYDQALLARTYLEAYQITGNEFYAGVARETLDYVLNQMTGPEGGFYSAEDADSPDPEDPSKKKEGAFYVWTEREILDLFPENQAKLLAEFYGIRPEGNVRQDPHGEFVNQNVLYQAQSLGAAAEKLGLPAAEAEKLLADGRRQLAERRKTRPAPSLDDKVLTDWNGLMIASLAFASRVLEDARYLEKAREAGLFIRQRLKTSDGELLHRYRKGEAGIRATLDDYAFLIYAFLALYEATFEAEWLEEALDLNERMVRRFWDGERGGFYLTVEEAPFLIARPKESYDGAIPSGNSVALLDLLLLARITGDATLKEKADQTLGAFAAPVASQPMGYTQFLSAVDYAIGPSQEVVIAGPLENAEAKEMVRTIYRAYLPNKIVLHHPAGPAGAAIEALAPFTKGQNPVDARTAVYVCENYTCKLPVTESTALKKVLSKHSLE